MLTGVARIMNRKRPFYLTLSTILVALLFLFLSTSNAENPTPVDRDNRQALKEKYFREYVSSEVRPVYQKIHAALNNVLDVLPHDVFSFVTNPDLPVVFVTSTSDGIARFAHSRPFIKEGKAEQSFKNGFYLIVLGDELDGVDDIQAIEGVLLHEMAHPFLKHYKSNLSSCEQERQANQQVIAWGFKTQFQAAKSAFGHKTTGDSPCH